MEFGLHCFDVMCLSHFPLCCRVRSRCLCDCVSARRVLLNERWKEGAVSLTKLINFFSALKTIVHLSVQLLILSRPLSKT